jgi:hypothetical protein
MIFVINELLHADIQQLIFCYLSNKREMSLWCVTKPNLFYLFIYFFFFFCTINYEAALQLNHVLLFPFPFFHMLTRKWRPIPPHRQIVFSGYIASDVALRFDVVKPEFVQRHASIIVLGDDLN